jgi:uncharacterized phage infection (PIP) family protein YhgE
VVATEVRNLAQRSAGAAKEIKTLIADSVDKVEAGTRLVDDAGKTMDEIVSSIQSVADIMAEITAASAEQRDGIQQVNQAITKMDEATQQNAALVEEAAAAGSMRDQANNLNQAVGIFKLQENTAGTPHRSAAPVASRPVVKPAPASAQVAKVTKVAAIPAASHSQKVSKQAKEDDWEEF